MCWWVHTTSFGRILWILVFKNALPIVRLHRSVHDVTLHRLRFFSLYVEHDYGNILWKRQRFIFSGSKVMGHRTSPIFHVFFSFVDNRGGNIWPNQPEPPTPVSMLIFGLCGSQQPALAQHWWWGAGWESQWSIKRPLDMGHFLYMWYYTRSDWPIYFRHDCRWVAWRGS